MKRVIFPAVVAVLLWTTGAMAENSVIVPSLSVAKGATGVVIPIMFTNDVQIKGLNIPLVLRELTPGAFVTSLTMSFGDRLPMFSGVLEPIVYRNQYADEDGTCKSNQPGGFGTITSATGGPNPVVSSPEGLLFIRQALFSFGYLDPGADVTGSFILTVDVTSEDGMFEIDTTCANPASHLLYVQINNTGLIPDFTKGIITIGNPNNPPNAVCLTLISVEADGSCQGTATPAQVDGGSFDPDGDGITLALNPPGPYALGPNPVWLVVTDDHGDKDSCQTAIAVVDVTPPVITSCPGHVSVQCTSEIPPPDINAVTATDNCSVTVEHEGDVSDNLSCPETIYRTYRVSDGSGDPPQTCTQAIIVHDTQPPVLSGCPGDISVQCLADVPPPADVTASDNCAATLDFNEVDNATGNPCGGTIVRTWTATDGCGNTDVCTQTITVLDTESPIITSGPPDADVQCEADIPPFDNAQISATDNCGSVWVAFAGDDPLVGGPCGGTVVRRYSVTDACGNETIYNQLFTVTDTEAPQLVSCAGFLNFQCLSEVPPCDAADATFTDNCGIPTVDCVRTDNGGAGSIADPLIITDTYTATDGCGNTNDCVRTITVVDDTPPSPGCPGNIVKVIGAGETEAVVTWVSNYSDNCAGGSVECVPPSGSTFSLGPTTVTCTATDAAGNVNACSFTVTVSTASVPPEAICADVTVSADANCQADASIDNGSYDPDGGGVTLSQDPPGPYQLGQTVVQLIVTDDEGDVNTCSATVTVEDNTPPVVSCSGDIDVDILEGEPGAVVDFTSTVTDNCPGATVACVPPSGSLFPPGPTTVTCTGTDASGNTSQCSFTVTVHEAFTNPPVAVDDHKSTRGGAILYLVGAGVLVNDYDIDGDPMTAILDTDVSVGTLTLDPSGSFKYLAPIDYVGPVQFTYYANDGLANSVAPATVYINVKPNMFLVADFDQDGFITLMDLGAEIDALFGGGPNPRSIECNASCADFNCDGEPNASDLGMMVDYLYEGGTGPCDPCAK